MAEKRAIELAKLALVEREAWDAWERSKNDAEVKTLKAKKAEAGGAGSPVEQSIRTEGQTGDATYLRTVLECGRARCKVLGLYAPTRHALDLSSLTNEELEAELARLEAELKAASGQKAPR